MRVLCRAMRAPQFCGPQTQHPQHCHHLGPRRWAKRNVHTSALAANRMNSPRSWTQAFRHSFGSFNAPVTMGDHVSRPMRVCVHPRRRRRNSGRGGVSLWAWAQNVGKKVWCPCGGGLPVVFRSDVRRGWLPIAVNGLRSMMSPNSTATPSQNPSRSPPPSQTQTAVLGL